MSQRKHLFIVIMLGLPLMLTSASVVAQGDFARETLRGIPGVHVAVDMSLPPDFSALDSIRGLVLEELNQFVQDYQPAKQPE